jgi:hypothetical protein
MISRFLFAGIFICQSVIGLFASSKEDFHDPFLEVSQTINKTIFSSDFFNPDSPTAGLQEAIDFLKPEGGTLIITPGVYSIRKSVTLFSDITIKGYGEHTIIERADPCFETKPIADAEEGSLIVKAMETSGFVTGGEVIIASSAAQWWDCTSATITRIDGNKVHIDQPLKKSYLTSDKAAIANFFPVFTATSAKNIRIEKLTIDGKMPSGSDFGCHFIASAIHFNMVEEVYIESVTVKRYPADGFSIQRGCCAKVLNCLAEYNLGNGFHPGTGLTNSTWRQNTGRFNGRDGFFFCHRVKYATVADNHFYNNKKSGIGDLGRGGKTGDQQNVVSGNFCYNNGRAGIECTVGGNNVIVNNVCENNSQEEPGKWAGINLKDSHSTILSANRCSDSQMEGEKTQEFGIQLIGTCINNIISGNILTGHSQGGISDICKKSNTLTGNIVLDIHTSEVPKYQP